MVRPPALTKVPKPSALKALPLTRPSRTLYQIYLRITRDYTKHVKQTLQYHFPDRWDMKITDSYAASVMFADLEPAHRTKSDAEKERLVKGWMTSAVYESPHNLHSVMLRENYMTIIIHFPELTINNTNGRVHTIQDLYVRMRFSPLFTTTGGENLFYGLRTSMWYAEMGSDYCFSHLSGRFEDARRGCWTGFCLGSTDFSILCNDMRTVFDKDKFEFLCIQLPDYLSWESVEGRPYRYIKDIGERSLFGNGSSGQIDSNNASRVIAKILASEPEIPTRIAKGGTVYTMVIKDCDEFSEMVTRHIDNLNYLNIWDPVTKRANPISRNNKADELRRIKTEANSQGSLFVFRDQPVHFKVLDQTTESAPITGPFMVKPDVLRTIINVFNNKFAQTLSNEYQHECRL